MDAIEQLKEDVHAGQVDANRLIDLIATLQRELHAFTQQNAQLQQQNAQLQQRIAELEKELAGLSGTTKIALPFSLREEEKRQNARGKKRRKRKAKGRRGRVRTADKIAQAERTEDVYPDDIPQGDCKLSHTRPVWRLENGRAVLVAYRIFRGPNNR